MFGGGAVVRRDGLVADVDVVVRDVRSVVRRLLPVQLDDGGGSVARQGRDRGRRRGRRYCGHDRRVAATARYVASLYSGRIK